MINQDTPSDNGQQPSDDANDGSAENIIDLEAAQNEANDGAMDAYDPEAELAELKERFLRLAAELENTRRRGAREKADAGRYAIANFARDLLGVADNFDRALHSISDDASAPTSEAITSMITGLQMTEKELLTTLERHGVQRIIPAGEKFDPNLHQAVAQVPGGEIPNGHVVNVAQPGFTIGDRVLRAAMVTVSSGTSS